MTRAIKETPVALRWLARFGLSTCNYNPARCAVVYAVAHIIRIAKARKRMISTLRRDMSIMRANFDTLHDAVNKDARYWQAEEARKNENNTTESH